MSAKNANMLLAGEDTGDVTPANTPDDWKQRAKHYVTAYCELDAAADTDIERILFSASPSYTGGIILFGAWIVPDAAVTGDPDNNAVLQLGTRPKIGGGSQTAIGSALTTTASWVALSQVTLYSSSGGVAVAQNINITLDRTHNGTGVVLPNMRVVLEFALA